MRRLLLALATLSPFCFFASPALAGLEVCNPTSAVQNLAVAYKSGGSWVSSGWWRIAPEDCVTPIEDDLTFRFYYFHVAENGWAFRDDGIAFCIKEQDFIASGGGSCTERGFQSAQFARLDTGRDRPADYVVNLEEYLDQGAAAESGSGTGRLGVPFAGNVIFQGCGAHARSGSAPCELVGDGIVYHVPKDVQKTPPALIAFLEGLETGTPLFAEGNVSKAFEAHADLVLRSAVLREANALDHVLALLQGHWQSRTDASDTFVVSGAERQSFYSRTRTALEHIAVMETCGDASETGMFLYAWDTQGGSGLCYLIESIDRSALTLRYLPRGTVLTYQRAGS